ncbi:MAG: hypothetical protein JWM80_3624 [Cyanobacteria bacterium RYN_339]|nr:hypothetical protein [Cyanobacteria bacterium RYN_339]
MRYRVETMVVRFLLSIFLSLFLVGLTSAEGRIHVLALQDQLGMERMCEDETLHVRPAELRVEAIRRGRMPYRPAKRRTGPYFYVSRPIPKPERRPQLPRAPPHQPRAPPFAA